ncbi:MAG: FAD-dependent oxidoreductase [Gammaproteobacteria bacterium]|nr:FAD-dependent oxidoreductase [Gammaproteobacteria bacterium]
MNTSLPTHAQVVIIGGGIIGCSVAWHLTRLGWTDVVLLERQQLGCGTTWHSAGNIVRLDTSPTMIQIYRYGAELYSEIEQETGQAVGWRNCGRVMVARTPERVAEFQHIITAARNIGTEVELVTPGEVRDRLPILRTDDLLGAIWSPGDGRVNPTDLLTAYARGARSRGARIIEAMEVHDIETANGAVTAVSSQAGRIKCEVIVNCAGLWARQLGQRHDVTIPLYPTEHFYLLTEPIEGIDSSMPTFRDPDGLVYGREEVGGLLFGCFDRNAKPIAPDTLPKDFSFTLLNEDWEQFGPYMTEGIRRIPALKQAGVRKLLNGPESFTPDGYPIMGQAPGLKGYFVLAGMNSAGVTTSAGMGRVLAHWIVNGAPDTDISCFDMQRFRPEHNEESWLREKIRHVPSAHMDIGIVH